MVSLKDMYYNCSILANAKDKAGQHVAEYEVIMSGVKSGQSEKRLASQFIARFYKYFPSLANDSLDALFDLCEDDDIDIRKQAIRDLPTLSRDSVEHSERIAFILLQLMATVNDASEICSIQGSLVTILKTNPAGTLTGVFSLMLNGDDNEQQQAVVFLNKKLLVLLSEKLVPEIEEMIVENCKKVIGDLSDSCCLMLVQTLKFLPTISTTLTGRLFMLDIIANRINSFEEKFACEDNKERIDLTIKYLKESIDLLSKNVSSTCLIKSICVYILPAIDVDVSEETKNTNSDLQIELLQLLAEIVNFCNQRDASEDYMTNVYYTLCRFIPMPDVSNDCSQNAIISFPLHLLSKVEIVLFIFHHLSQLFPEFLTSANSGDRLRELRIRLQFLSRVIQNVSKKMSSNQMNCNSLLQLNVSKEMTERMINNIFAMIKDFFHNPPSYKSTITLSFQSVGFGKTTDKTNVPLTGKKRKNLTPIVFESDLSQKKKKTPAAQIAGQVKQLCNTSTASLEPLKVAMPGLVQGTNVSGPHMQTARKMIHSNRMVERNQCSNNFVQETQGMNILICGEERNREFMSLSGTLPRRNSQENSKNSETQKSAHLNLSSEMNHPLPLEEGIEGNVRVHEYETHSVESRITFGQGQSNRNQSNLRRGQGGQTRGNLGRGLIGRSTRGNLGRGHIGQNHVNLSRVEAGRTRGNFGRGQNNKTVENLDEKQNKNLNQEKADNSPRGQSQNRKGPFQNNRGQFQNNRGHFQNNRGHFQNNRGQFQPSRGQFQNSRGQFQNSRGQFQNGLGRAEIKNQQRQTQKSQGKNPGSQNQVLWSGSWKRRVGEMSDNGAQDQMIGNSFLIQSDARKFNVPHSNSAAFQSWSNSSSSAITDQNKHNILQSQYRRQSSGLNGQNTTNPGTRRVVCDESRVYNMSQLLK